jgi:hypothetical protein
MGSNKCVLFGPPCSNLLAVKVYTAVAAPAVATSLPNAIYLSLEAQDGIITG